MFSAQLTACSGGALTGGRGAAAAAGADKQGNSAPHWSKPWLVPEPTQEPGAVFLLNGEPWCFHGANNYYMAFKSQAMIDSVFENAKKIGLKVLRHWAFTDRGSLDGRVRSVDGDGTKEGVYFQYWDAQAGAPAYHEGPNGLQRLDRLVASAREAGIRLVLVLTNNWRHFGGMDQYLTWYGLKEHPKFYTDERVKKAYKDWVAYLLNRVNSVTGVAYKDDPSIFAWELANEPRIRNHTDYDAPKGWDKTTITRWADEMAAHVRAIDPQHLVAVGDEGFFARGSDAFYNGDDGVDHDALLHIPDIDFGTYHLYPDHWGVSPHWGGQWIVDHIEAARKAGKPTVLEEYGVMVRRDEKTDAIVRFGDKRELAYSNWNELVLQGGGAGALFWMLGGYDDYVKKNYKDYDHFTVYSPDTDPTAQLLQTYAQRFAKEARVCQLARDLKLPAKRNVPPDFVTVSIAPGTAANPN